MTCDLCFVPAAVRTTGSIMLQGPVVRKPINFHVVNFLVNVYFVYSCFQDLTSSYVKYCQISALNSIWEYRNKLLG